MIGNPHTVRVFMASLRQQTRAVALRTWQVYLDSIVVILEFWKCINILHIFYDSILHNISLSNVIVALLSLQELILPLLLLGLLILISTLNPHVSYGSISTKELEYERDLSLKGLGYTPINNVTNHIMEEVARELRTSEFFLYIYIYQMYFYFALEHFTHL